MGKKERSSEKFWTSRGGKSSRKNYAVCRRYRNSLYNLLCIFNRELEETLKRSRISDETYDIVSSFFNQDDDSAIIRIDASDVEKIASKIRKITKSKKLKQPILVVPMELRHMMFVILSEFVPSITVIANEELADNADVKYIGMI